MDKSSELAKEIRKIVAAEVAANLLIFVKEITGLKTELERLSKEPRMVFSPNIQMPKLEQPVIKIEAPIVHPTPVHMHVPEQAAPVVHNHIQAPIVNPTPVEVNVNPEMKIEKSAPPVVHVNVSKLEITKMPEREITTVVLRDEKNRAKGTLTTEKDKE